MRFTEFSEEWKKTILRKECIINPQTKGLDNQFLYIDLESVVKGQLIKQNVILKKDAPSRAQRVLSKWDIIFQCVRPYQLNNYIVRDDISMQRVASTGYAQIRTQHNPNFFFQLLHTKSFTNQVLNRCTGTNYPAINSTDLSDVEIFIPKKEEQEKIGSLLTFLDERIAIQNKVIEKYESLIKAITDKVVERLLKGRLVAFRELYTEASEGGTPSTSEHKYYENGSIPFIKIDDLSSKYLTTNKDFITELGVQKSTAWIIPENSVIFSNGATIGAISINTYPVCTKQGILGIVPKPGVGTEYLYYLMSSSYFNKQIQRIVTEGTMKTAYLKDINHIKCPLPTTGIQEKMVSGLSSITSKIDLEKQIRNKLLSTKNYLLQSLFI